MEFLIEGLGPSLITAFVNDLHQTAKFTKTNGGREENPLTRWLVKSPSENGEIILGTIGLGGTLYLEKLKLEGRWVDPIIAFETAYLMGTIAAVMHNQYSKGHEVPGVIFPTLTIKW